MRHVVIWAVGIGAVIMLVACFAYIATRKFSMTLQRSDAALMIDSMVPCVAGPMFLKLIRILAVNFGILSMKTGTGGMKPVQSRQKVGSYFSLETFSCHLTKTHHLSSDLSFSRRHG